MCLSVVYRGKQKKEALAKLPDVMTGWAAVYKSERGQYVPAWRCQPLLHAGRNKAVQSWVYFTYGSYRSGFHRFLSRKHALDWAIKPLLDNEFTMSCKIHKKDITTIGEQEGMLCVVAKQITCPKYCGKKVKK